MRFDFTAAQYLQFAIAGLVAGSIYALLALGFNTVFSVNGVINLAQGEFVMLGGMFYYTATFDLELPIVLAATLAIMAVMLCAAAMERIIIRPARETTTLRIILLTLGCALLASAVASAVWGVNALRVPKFTAGSPFHFGSVVVTRQQAWVIAVTVVAAVLLAYFFRRTNTGLAMRSIAENRLAAQSVGIPVERMVLVAFVIAGLLGGIAGVLITPITSVNNQMGLALSIKGFTAALLGGIGSMPGAVAGGLLLGLLEAFGEASLSSGYSQAMPLLVLLIIFVARPTGVLGESTSIRR